MRFSRKEALTSPAGLRSLDVSFAIARAVRFKNAALRQIVDARMKKFCYYSHEFWEHLMRHVRAAVQRVENSVFSPLSALEVLMSKERRRVCRCDATEHASAALPWYGTTGEMCHFVVERQ